MGAGKTTIGRMLAKKLAVQFYDSDHEIELRTGADIPWIFEIEGEDGFRKRESAMIEELTQLERIVLATGGGAVLDENNCNNLKQNGIVIYLKSTPEKLFKRTQTDKRRPLLQTNDKYARIQSILQAREPLYQAVADEVIETDRLTVSKIVNTILDMIEHYEHS